MSDEYWIDPTPNFQKNAWSHVSGPSFFDAIIKDDGRVGGWTAIGADDYVIVPHAGSGVAGHRHRGGHRHQRYHSSPAYWAPPLYYTGIDFNDVAVNSSQDDPTDIPDAWEGNWKKRKNSVEGEVGGLNPASFATPGGWSRAARNPLLQWKAKWKSDPPMAFATMMQHQIREIKGGLARNENLTLLHHHMVLDFIINHRRLPSGYPNFTGENGQLVEAAKAKVAGEERAYESAHRSPFADVAGAIGDVVKFAGLPITGLASLTKDIPVLGTVLNAAVSLDPGQQIGNISSAVGRGERLDKAILAEGRKSIQAVKDVAPYVQTALTFIPCVGTWIAAAISAGTALAEGRSISDAVVDGLRNAVPGGALGKTAFNAALAIAHGESISNVALDAVKKTLPSAAQQAVDAVQAVASGKPITQAALTAIQRNLPTGAAQKVAEAVRSASTGKNVREAVLQVVRASLPPDAQKALEVGVATAIGRNAQSAVANAAPKAIEKFAAKKTPPRLVALKPKAVDQAKGFDVAVGMLQHSAVTPTAMQKVRLALKPSQQAGFDQGVKAVRNVHTENTFSSLVRGGIVSRANWKPVGRNDRGAVPGRLVKDGRIVQGYYARA